MKDKESWYRKTVALYQREARIKTLIGYKGYLISSVGVVYKILNTGNLRPLKPTIFCGRQYVTLRDSSGKQIQSYVSRLVAYAFCNKPKLKTDTVIHKDGDLLNDNANNLEWGFAEAAHNTEAARARHTEANRRQARKRYGFLTNAHDADFVRGEGGVIDVEATLRGLIPNITYRMPHDCVSLWSCRKVTDKLKGEGMRFGYLDCKNPDGFYIKRRMNNADVRELFE